MSAYQKTLKSMNEFKSISAHIKSLGKIMTESEDKNLTQILRLLILELQHIYSDAKNKSMPFSLAQGKSQEAMNLSRYCNQAIGTKIPEWQLIAEKNGWAPPKT